MTNKKTLIILSIVLLLVVTTLIIYSFQINQIETSLVTQPSVTTPDNKGTETKESSSIDLEKIKASMSNVDNESFQLKEIEEDQDCATNKESQQYEEEIVEGKVSVSSGEVLEKGSNYIKVKFQQNAFEWISKVTINSETSILTVDGTSHTTQSSFSSIQTGSKVLVQSKVGNITDSSFVGGKVVVLR